MKNKWSVIILTAVFALAFCVTACGRNDDDTSNVSDDKGTINEALELYQSTARKVKALNSVSYKAASDTRLKFNKDESQKASSRISVKEIYTDDSLQLFLSESSNNYGTPSRQTIYYKDGTAYYRVNSSTGKEKIELDKFMTSSAAQSNPLVCLKQNRIFDISEDSLTECEKEQENGQDIIKLKLNDEDIAEYLTLDANEEFSIYGNGFSPYDLEIEIVLGDSGLPETIEIDYSVKLSTGKGEIEWEYAFEDYNSVKKIDYPNLKKYK